MGQGALNYQGIKSGLKLNDVIEQFNYVYQGQRVNAGDFVNFVNGVASHTNYGSNSAKVFNKATTRYYMSACKLSSTKAVVAYRDGGNSNYGTAIVVSISSSGPTISFGSEKVFNSASTGGISICALSSSKVAISYNDGGNSSNGTAIIGTISSTSITFGSEVVFKSASIEDTSICAESSSKIAIAYGGDDNWRGTAIVGTVSGTSITFGNETQFTSRTLSGISICSPTSGKVAIAFGEEESEEGKAVVGSVSGKSITFGGNYTFNSGAIEYPSICAESSSKIVIAYVDHGNSSCGTAIVGTISSTSITFGSKSVFKSGTTYYTSVCKVNTNKVAISCKDNTKSKYGTVRVGSISNRTIAFGNEYTFESDEAYDIVNCPVDTNKFLIAYSDAGNSNYGTARFLKVEDTTITSTFSETIYEKQVKPATAPPFDGIALSDGTGGTSTAHKDRVTIAVPNV